MKTYLNSYRGALTRSFLLPLAALMVGVSTNNLAAQEWNGPSDWAKFDVAARRAVWVWNPVSMDGTTDQNKNWDGSKNSKIRFFENYKGSRDLFFDFCENKSIRVVYMFVGIYQYRSADYTAGVFPYEEENMLPFMEEANARGIQVWYMYYLNDTRDSTTLNGNTNQIVRIAQTVDNFNKKYPNARFAGIHCDQEPNDETVYPGLLNNTKKAYDWIEESGSDLLTSQALRPKWRNQEVTWNGETKVMNEHMQDWLHHSVLMAYSDEPSTVDSWSSAVIDYADSIGRKAAIGSEVADLSGFAYDASGETWYEEIQAESAETRFKVGSADFVTWEDMMHSVVDKHEATPSFDRMAIHGYSQYFRHWFGDLPRDYLLGLEGGVYDSAVINPEKVDLTVDTCALFGYVPNPDANRHPVAYAGENRAIFDSDGKVGEMVELDGSGSTDDVGIVSYIWTRDGVEIATGMKPTIFLADGEHVITLEVTDGGGLSRTHEVMIDVFAPFSVTPALFEEDFETATPGFDQLDPAKGWEQVSKTNYVGIGDYGPDGSQAVSLSDQRGWINQAIDTTGYKAITVSFDLKVEGYADGKSGTVRYSKDAGKNWIEVAGYDNTHTEYQRYSVKFPADAEDNPDFILRFHSLGDNKTDITYVDNIIVTAISIDGGDGGDGGVDEPGEAYMKVMESGFHLGGVDGSGRLVRLKWGSVSSDRYTIWTSEDLVEWSEEVSDIASGGEVTELEFTPSELSSDKRFFQIRKN